MYTDIDFSELTSEMIANYDGNINVFISKLLWVSLSVEQAQNLIDTLQKILSKLA